MTWIIFFLCSLFVKFLYLVWCIKYRTCDVYDDFVDSKITYIEKAFTGVSVKCCKFYVYIWWKAFKCVMEHKCAKQSKFRINGKRNITSLAPLSYQVYIWIWTATTTTAITITKSLNGSRNEHISCFFYWLDISIFYIVRQLTLLCS